jgi:hypothetical protein
LVAAGDGSAPKLLPHRENILAIVVYHSCKDSPRRSVAVGIENGILLDSGEKGRDEESVLLDHAKAVDVSRPCKNTHIIHARRQAA